MILTLAQCKIAEDTHRFRVVNCGRRFGKTTLAVEEIKGKAISKPRRIAYIANTYNQARDICWEMLKAELAGAISDKNEQRLEIRVKTLAGGESVVVLRGWESIETLRGQSFDFIVMDEIASMKNFEINWQQVIRPTLSDRRGEVLFISTPQGFNHFYNLYNQETKDNDFKSFHFTTKDNPHIKPEEIDKAQQELTEDHFAQEYLADFRSHTGVIYKEFDRKKHVIDPISFPYSWRFFRAMDFGATDPTVCLWVAVDANDNFYIYDEYYNAGQTSKFHSEVILSKHKDPVVATYGDPSANQEMLDYAMFGLIVTPAPKIFSGDQDWVMSGINAVRQKFKENKVFIFKNCTTLITDIETQHWKETNSGLLKDMPDHGNSHGPDALRYFVVSYYPSPKHSEFENEIKEFNKFTGY